MDAALWATTLKEAKIGRFQNVATATPDTPLLDILRLFITKSISAIPILDADGKFSWIGGCTNLYEKYDILTVAKDGPNYNLSMPVSEALLKRPTVIVIKTGLCRNPLMYRKWYVGTYAWCHKKYRCSKVCSIGRKKI